MSTFDPLLPVLAAFGVTGIVTGVGTAVLAVLDRRDLRRLTRSTAIACERSRL